MADAAGHMDATAGKKTTTETLGSESGKKGMGGGGVTGVQWLQWVGMERGRGLRPTHFEDRR